MHQSSPYRLALVTALLLTGACGGDGPPDLRAGYSVALTVESDDNSLVTTMITDVAMSGDLVVIVGSRITSYDIAGGLPYVIDLASDSPVRVVEGTSATYQPLLLVSRDRGRSWQSRDLVPVGPFSLYCSGLPGILLKDGQAFVTVRTYHTAGDGLYPDWIVARVDLETGYFEPLSDARFTVVGELDGLVTAAWIEGDPRAGGYGNWYWLTLDPLTGAATSGSKGYRPGDCTGPLFFTGSWRGVCWQGGRTCGYSLDPRSQEGPRIEGCAEGTMQVSDITADGLRLRNEDARVLGGRLDFGPGTLAGGWLGGLHHRFGGLAGVSDQGRIRLYELVDDEPRELPLGSPCRDAARCPRADLVFLQGSGDDEHLLVYALPRDGGQVIVVGFETGLRYTPPEKILQTPTPASALDRQCVEASLCLGDAFFYCRSRWLSLSSAPGTIDLPYARFLAIAPGDCDGFLNAMQNATDRYGLPLFPANPCLETGCEPCTESRCEGDWLVECPPYGGAGWVDCLTANGHPCRTLEGRAGCFADLTEPPPVDSPLACDELGRAVSGNMVEDCPARGLVCSPMGGGEGCQLATRPCPPPPAEGVCDGTLAYDCWNSSASVWSVRDCGRFDLECHQGICGPAPELLSCTNTRYDSCEGTVLTYCGLSGELRFVDCADFGATCRLDDASIFGACVRP